MGNRAVISFQDSSENTLDTSQVGIYLHWNGGLESIEGFCKAATDLNISEPARFIQMLGNWFGGNQSLYVDVISRLDYDNYDNGTYVLSKASGEWKVVKRFFVDIEYKVNGHDEYVQEMADDVFKKSVTHFVKQENIPVGT
tara:strand:- start:885 stop:1307 length:423 start_codon:yes stop_codon:yes gene_type:complete